MKIYCINLKRSTERRKKMEAELEKLPFEHEFIEAVDGRELREDEVAKVYSKWRTRFRKGKGLARGELGCALSHVKFYRIFLESSDPCAFVFEDDVTIGTHADTALLEAEKFLSEAKDPTIVQIAGNERDDVSSVSGQDVFVKLVSAVGTYAYGVNRSAAELLCKEYTPVKMPIDSYGYLHLRRGLQILRYRERVLTVDMKGESTIGNERFGLKMGHVKKVFWKVWRLIGVAIDRCLD